MTRALRLKSIGTIHTPFSAQEGTPIQPTMAEGALGWIELKPEYIPALKDLDGFERIWLLYWFDRAGGVKLNVVPYLDTVRRGLFATRAPARPNPIGLSSVRLLSIEKSILRIADVDMLDNTPLLDIKPYCPRFDCYEVSRAGWLDNAKVKRATADTRFSGRGKSQNEKA